MLWQKGESAVTIRELCEKEVVQLEQGVCLGRADDLEFDPATAQLQSLILLGRPRLLGLLGRDESLTIPWREIETIGTDAILVHTAVPEAPAAPRGFWQQLRATLGLCKIGEYFEKSNTNFCKIMNGHFRQNDYNRHERLVQIAQPLWK